MGVAKSAITKLTNRLKKEGYEIKRSHGYRHSTAFVNKNGYYVYISVNDDDRRFLVRTANHDKDFTGGNNTFVSFSGSSDFREEIDHVNCILNRSARDYMDSSSVVSVEYPIITLTYALGNSEDAERFESKFDNATDSDKFKILNIPSIEILPDDEDTWNISNVEFDISEIDKDLLKEFIYFSDSI